MASMILLLSGFLLGLVNGRGILVKTTKRGKGEQGIFPLDIFLLGSVGLSMVMSYAVPGRSVMPDSLQHHGLQPARLLCPWGFFRQECWSGLPCPSPEDLPNPGLEPRSLVLPVDSLLSEPPEKPIKGHTPVKWPSLNSESCSLSLPFRFKSGRELTYVHYCV